MSKEDYLIKETITENVVRLYEANGGVVAFGPSAIRMELLTGGKYKVARHQVLEVWEDEPAIYIPTEELLKSYATQLVASDEPGVYTIAGEAFVAEEEEQTNSSGQPTGSRERVVEGCDWPADDDDGQTPLLQSLGSMEGIYEKMVITLPIHRADNLRPYNASEAGSAM